MSQFNLQDFYPYRLAILSKTISQLIEREYNERFSLNLHQWRIIVVLAAHKELTASDITKHTLMDKMMVSRTVKSLIQKNAVSRHSSQDDGRLSPLRLTDYGRTIYNRVLPIAQKYEYELLSALSMEELSQLHKLVTKLQVKAEQLTEAQLTS